MTPHITTVNIDALWPALYRKVGGLHWLRIGRLRIAVCWCRRQ